MRASSSAHRLIAAVMCASFRTSSNRGFLAGWAFPRVGLPPPPTASSSCLPCALSRTTPPLQMLIADGRVFALPFRGWPPLEVAHAAAAPTPACAPAPPRRCVDRLVRPLPAGLVTRGQLSAASRPRLRTARCEAPRSAARWPRRIDIVASTSLSTPRLETALQRGVLSIDLRYSLRSSRDAWRSPRASAGLMMLRRPGALARPPTMVSARQRTETLPRGSRPHALMRSSNWPRLLVPATRACRAAITRCRACAPAHRPVDDRNGQTLDHRGPLAEPPRPAAPRLFFERRLKI